MMKPKFRVWDKRTKSMWKIDRWHIEDEYFDLTEFNKNIADPSAEIIWRKQDDIILMQSTGLKDKDGVDIYEGDILLHTSSSVNHSDTYWHSYVQVYRMNSGAYRIKGKHIYDTELISARNRLEVVGNIYQNQNLLVKEYFSTSDGIVEQDDES